MNLTQGINTVWNIQNTKNACPRIQDYIFEICWLSTSLILLWQTHRVLQKYLIFVSTPVIIQNKTIIQIFHNFKNLPRRKYLRIRLHLETPKCVGVLLPSDYKKQCALQFNTCINTKHSANIQNLHLRVWELCPK